MLWFFTGGYLVKRWFIPAAARARGQSYDLNREILASNLFNCHKEVINAPPVPSISRCIHIVYRHKNVWEYQWSNFIYNCMSTFLHYVHCKDALLDCSAPGGERCESLTWVDEIAYFIISHTGDSTLGTLCSLLANHDITRTGLIFKKYLLLIFTKNEDCNEINFSWITTKCIVTTQIYGYNFQSSYSLVLQFRNLTFFLPVCH